MHANANAGIREEFYYRVETGSMKDLAALTFPATTSWNVASADRYVSSQALLRMSIAIRSPDSRWTILFDLRACS